MEKASCIICACNEEPRIGKVLEVVTQHPLIDEIIVIDDHSNDATIQVVHKFKNVHLIHHLTNMGKARSMFDGCRKVKNAIILFLDADLVGITHENLTQLILPVANDVVEMTMTICKYTGILGLFLDFIGNECLSGERVLKRDLAKKILEHADGYDAEIQINQYFLDHKLKFLIVPWTNVKPIRKKDKVGLGKVLFDTCKEFNKFVHLFSVQFLRQAFLMGKLSERYQQQSDNAIPSSFSTISVHN